MGHDPLKSRVSSLLSPEMKTRRAVRRASWWFGIVVRGGQAVVASGSFSAESSESFEGMSDASK